MLIGPFRLTALAEWKTIYILKRVVEGENYHYHTMELQQNLPPPSGFIQSQPVIWNKVYNG